MMRVPVVLWCMVGALACAWGDDAARIREIARFLPAQPGIPGAHVSSREPWKRLASLPEAAAIVKEAETACAGKIPELRDEWYLEFNRIGNRAHYEKPFLARHKALDRLILAECLENKGRFLSKINDYLLAICRERSWTYPAHDADLANFNRTKLSVDLAAGARAWSMAVALNWLKGKIPARTEARVREEIDTRIFKPYLTTARGEDVSYTVNPFVNNVGHWWFDYPNNWNAVCHSCVVRTALALVPDAAARAEFVAAAERTRASYLAAFTPDGYCDEGMGYWNYGYGHHLTLGLFVRWATNGQVDFFRDPKNRRIMLYPYGYRLQNGLSPHFADGGGNPKPTLLALGRQIWPEIVSTQAINAPLLEGELEVIALRAFGQEPVFAKSTGGRSQPYDVPPLRSFFPDAQVLLVRTQAGKGRPFSAAMKGGHNAELHNHNDIGSYTLMYDGVEMAGDPGGEVYTRRTFSPQRYVSKVLNSYAHPVPFPAATLQSQGRQYAGKVLKTDFSVSRDAYTLDLRGAYRLRGLEKLERTFTFDRDARVFTVSDEVVFDKPRNFSVPLVTYMRVEKGAAPGTFVLASKDGRQKVAVEIAVSGGAWTLVEESVENPGLPSVARLAVTLSAPVSRAHVSVTYRAL